MTRWLLLASLALFAACINNSIFKGSESNPESLETKFLQARWYFDHNEPEKAKPLIEDVLAGLGAQTAACFTLELAAELGKLCTRAKTLKGKIELVEKGVSTLTIASQLADAAKLAQGGVETLVIVLTGQTPEQRQAVAAAAEVFAQSASCVETRGPEACGLTKDDAKVAGLVTGLDAINKLESSGVIKNVNVGADGKATFDVEQQDPITVWKGAKVAGAVDQIQNAFTFINAGLSGNLTTDEQNQKQEVEEAQGLIKHADSLCQLGSSQEVCAEALRDLKQ